MPTGARPIAAVAAIVSFLMVPRGAFCDTAAAERHYAAGRAHLAAGDTAAAAEEFEKAVSEDPAHAEARYQLALLHARRILTYDRAEQELLDLPDLAARAAGRSRDDLLFRAGLALARLYVRKGDYGQAIALARNVAASAPAGAPLDDAYNILGLAYYYERLYEDALGELRRALKLNPGNTEARFNLKTIRTRLEHFTAGKAYSRMGQRREAIAEFRRAIALDPRFIDARHRLGVELLEGGDPVEALRELDRAASLAPGYRRMFEIRYAQGLALEAAGRPEEALIRFEEAVRARPRFAPAYNRIGLIRMTRGETEAAVAAFVKAIGLDPRTDYIRNLQEALARASK